MSLRGFRMGSIDALKSQISDAFSHVEHPGDWCLRGSNEGDEPYLLEQEFKGKSDWRVLDPKFIDQAPDGFGTALSFFSDEAFHFYLPAYLLADIDGLLEQHDPVFDGGQLSFVLGGMLDASALGRSQQAARQCVV